MFFYYSFLFYLIKSEEIEINNNVNNNVNNNNVNNISIPLTITITTSSSSNTGELGDSTTSNESRDGLFASLDNDGNGKITLEELTKFIEGSEEKTLDDQNDMKNQVTINTMNQLDSNNDNILKIEDLSIYWSSLGSLLSVEEVVDWITHSLLMPDSIVQSFIDNGITGYDFPELLESDGRLLEQELKITSVITKRRLMKGMKKKLLGVGTPPPIAQIPNIQIFEQSLCFTNLQIEWQPVIVKPSNDPADNYPVHLYRLQKQELTTTTTTSTSTSSTTTTTPNSITSTMTHNSQLSSTPISTLSSISTNSKWITVCEGVDTKCFDKIFTPPILNDIIESNSNTNSNSGGGNNNYNNPNVTVSYRLSSWNAIGRSEYRYIKYEITRPSINTWLSSSGLKEECYEQSNTQSLSFLSATELELMHLNSQKLQKVTSHLNSGTKDQQTNSQAIATLSNNPISLKLPNIFHQSEENEQIEQNIINSNNTTISTIIYHTFIFITNFFSFLWTIFSTGSSLITTLLSIISILVTFSISYLRLNPPNSNKNNGNNPTEPLHWSHTLIFLPIATSICPIIVYFLHLIPNLIPSSKSYIDSLVINLEFSMNPDNQKQVNNTQTTIRQQRVLKRMNSIRSNGDDSVDSQNSNNHDETDNYSDRDKCYICSQPVKFKISLKKMTLRTRHHCCHCLRIFCANCGVVTHTNPQCPVRGTCCCKYCDLKFNNYCKSTQIDNSNNNNNNNNNINDNSNNNIEIDIVSVQSDLTNENSIDEQSQQQLQQQQQLQLNDSNLDSKKKNKSFTSLFGIGSKKKNDKEKKQLISSDTNFSGLPPKPEKPQSKNLFGIPSLGKRVVSAPPIISLSPPPNITHSTTWPNPKMKDNVLHENFESNTDMLIQYANLNDFETS